MSTCRRVSPKNITISLSRPMKPRGAIRRLDHVHLNFNMRTCLIDDCVDSGPRDLRHPDRIRRLRCRHVACKRKMCGNIVPHGKKKGRCQAYIPGRFNAIALPPKYYYQGPLSRGCFTCQPSYHVAPDEAFSCVVKT